MSDESHDTAPTGGATQRAGRAPEAGGTVTALHGASESIPPAGEEIHLPGGTAIPVVMTVGITLALIGTTIAWLWTIIGGIIFMVCLAWWIRDTRREVAHLPDDLSSPTASTHH